MALAWIASYPKSGNTWARILLASYLRDRQVELRMAQLGRGRLDDAVPDLVNVLRTGTMLPVAQPRPLAVKTHFLPGRNIHDPYRDATTKVIYLVRNPRDVIPSAERMLNVSPDRRTAYAKHFIDNRGVVPWQRMGFGLWTENVLEWTTPERLHQYFPNTELLVLRYEDIKRDTAGSLYKMIDFLGFDSELDSDRVQRAVDNSALDKMRDAERRDDSLRHRDRNPFFGQGLSDQSLAGYGEDIEDAYRRLLREDEEFGSLAGQYGYAN
ncbi:sulfotransferase domain-containing protein [Streptomyces sp. NPDC050528]|uniref:sulfotransferase domain-containing protein n=1 Tax=Streptomyces sp. NPDC050528 TaxID=3365623 RepID=UPI0037B365EB